MTKIKNPYPVKSVQGIIVDLLAEGPLVGFYFSAAIMVLKETIDGLSDKELSEMFEHLLHPDRIRSNVNTIYERLSRLGNNNQ